MCQTDTFQVKSHRVLSDTISDLNDWYYNTQFAITEQKRSRVAIMHFLERVYAFKRYSICEKWTKIHD